MALSKLQKASKYRQSQSSDYRVGCLRASDSAIVGVPVRIESWSCVCDIALQNFRCYCGLITILLVARRDCPAAALLFSLAKVMT
jgi:hypothetical protein